MEEWIKIIAVAVFMLLLFIKNKKKQSQNFLDDLKEMTVSYFKDIDAEKGNYKGSWSAVEEWKEKMNKKAYELAKRFKKEGESKAVLEDWENLEYALNNGLCVIQDGNNPLTVKEGKGRDPEPLSPLGKIVVPSLVVLPIIFLYLVLSGIGLGIFVLTMAFPWFLFSSEQFKFRYLICVLLIGVLGYILNQWTYAQSGEIQLAITIGLPILYGLIYYKLHHKKSIREI